MVWTAKRQERGDDRCKETKKWRIGIWQGELEGESFVLQGRERESDWKRRQFVNIGRSTMKRKARIRRGYGKGVSLGGWECRGAIRHPVPEKATKIQGHVPQQEHRNRPRTQGRG